MNNYKKLNIHIYGQTWYCSTISKGCYIKFWDIYLQKVTEKPFSPTFSWDYQCSKSAYCIVKIKDKSIQNTGLGLARFQFPACFLMCVITASKKIYGSWYAIYFCIHLQGQSNVILNIDSCPFFSQSCQFSSCSWKMYCCIGHQMPFFDTFFLPSSVLL